VTFRRLKIRKVRHTVPVICALLVLFGLGLAQAQTPSARDVVAPAVYVSADPAARGVPFQLAVVFKIRPGFHVNAREKSADYLIATDLRAEMPGGFKAGSVVYPKGQLHTFTFSKSPLNVYEGTVTLRMPVTAEAEAPVGPQQIPLKLRYQACSTSVCLPPVTIDLQASINIVASAAAAKAAHPELFRAP
jgi:thioredoxin:protein disulfide reductase